MIEYPLPLILEVRRTGNDEKAIATLYVNTKSVMSMKVESNKYATVPVEDLLERWFSLKRPGTEHLIQLYEAGRLEWSLRYMNYVRHAFRNGYVLYEKPAQKTVTG